MSILGKEKMESDWFMWSEWTRIVLKTYKTQQDALVDLIKDYLDYSDIKQPNGYELWQISCIWWIAICSLGHDRILHFYGGRELEDSNWYINEAVAEMSKTAEVPNNALCETIKICDKIVSSGERIDIVTTCIMIPYTILTSAPTDLPFKLIDEKHFLKFDEMKDLALQIGADAWQEVMRDTWNTMLKQNF